MRAKTSDSKRVNPEAGVHVARLIEILDIGKQVDKFDQDGRNKLEFIWELPESLHVFHEDKGEQPLIVSRAYGNTLGRGSKMKAMIEGMLGKSIDKDFDLLSLKYKLCQLNLTLEEDGEYTNAVIQTAMPLGKEQLKVKYPHFNDWRVLDLDEFDQEVFDSLPQWKRDKIAKSETFKALEAEGVAVHTKDAEEQQAPPAAPPARKPAPAAQTGKVFGKAEPAKGKAVAKAGKR